MSRRLIRRFYRLGVVALFVCVFSVPAVAQSKLKGGRDAVPCDCTNCSAEHCPAPGKGGGGGKSGGGKSGDEKWIVIESVGTPPKSKSLKAPAKP